jgi:hypothetical protein
MPTFLGNKEINTFGLGNTFDTTIIQGSPLQIDYIIIAGGGGGGRGGGGGGTRFNGAGGGGGAGGVISGSTTLYKGVYQVIVGDGGDAGSVSKATNGETSSFLALTTIGGGAGGDAGDRDIPNCSIGSGSDGGSGGGGGSWTTLWGCDTSEGVAGQGFAGATAGGGGGAGGSTTDGNGGAGVLWLSGSSVFARGGFQGGSTIQNVTYGSGGRGANAFLLPRAFADPGIEGVVIIRYPGPQRALGGSIINNDGTFTYHTFLHGPFQDTFDYL